MEVTFDGVGKRYRYEWIFKNCSYQFESGKAYAILGPNGSGKSTLMKVLSGHLSPSKGQVVFKTGSENLDPNEVYRHVTFAAPYIELIEELTLMECLEFHLGFKTLRSGINTDQLPELMQLGKACDKAIRYFSSGMKQRLKLALAICSQSDLLLLDEPTTNLDEVGVNWYLDLVKQHLADRTVVVASNVAVDYSFCDAKLDIREYK